MGLETIGVNDGKVKINGSGGVDPSYLLVIDADQLVSYGVAALDFSSSPTSEFPQNIDIPADSDIWDSANETLIENMILGQGNLWRIEFDYSGKNMNDVAGLSILLSNTLSGFVANRTVALPAGRTSDTDQEVLLYTIADAASLPAPLGTGQGYELTLNCNKALTITITSLVRHSFHHNNR